MIETWNELFENTGVGKALNYVGKNGETLPQEFYMDTLRNYLGSVNSVRGASLEFVSVPDGVFAGQSFSVVVRARNTGLTYWTERDRYRLGTQNQTDNLIWGSGRFFLYQNEVVFPSGNKDFLLSLVAPTVPGNHMLSLKMLQEGVSWFGGSVSKSIQVLPAQGLSGDANGDGLVNGIDYIIWLNHFGVYLGGGVREGDFNGDGVVNGVDYVIWLGHFTG
jgi:hypothetical protein